MKRKDENEKKEYVEAEENTEEMVEEISPYPKDDESFKEFEKRFRKANPGISKGLRGRTPMTHQEYRVGMIIMILQGIVVMIAMKFTFAWLAWGLLAHMVFYNRRLIGVSLGIIKLLPAPPREEPPIY